MLHQYFKVKKDYSYWESYIKLIKASSAQKMNFPIKNFFSKYYQIRRKLWSLSMKKSLTKNLTKNNFCVVSSAVSLTWIHINPLSANPTKWPNTLKQFVG